MSEVAKLINLKKMGRTKMFIFLREDGILMEDNEPYQHYINNGYFKLVLKEVYGQQGQIKFSKEVTLVSPKGLNFIKKRILSREVENGSN